jgi:hypothetical protein
MQKFRDELKANLGRVDSLCEYAKNQGWIVTPVRMLEVLIWIECDPNKNYVAPK